MGDPIFYPDAILNINKISEGPHTFQNDNKCQQEYEQSSESTNEHHPTETNSKNLVEVLESSQCAASEVSSG